MKHVIIAAATAMAIGSMGHAATLDGTTVDFSLDNENLGTVYTASFTAGSGLDASDANYSVDVNTKSSNGSTGFKLVVEPNSTNNGFVTNDGSITTLVFSGLDFGTNVALTDFIVTGASAAYSSFDILSPTSIAFHFVDSTFSVGANNIVLSGDYVLATPIPAGGLLLLGGLGALAVAARRRKKAAD